MNSSTRYFILLLILLEACSSSNESRRSEQVRPSIVNSTLINLSAINSADDDFAPWLDPSLTTLYFTSNRSIGTTQLVIDSKSKFGEHLYASQGKGASWLAPIAVQGLGESVHNTGTFTISDDGTTAYLSASYRKGGTGGTDIFRSYRAGAQWGNAECMKTLSSTWWDAHPVLSPDGRMIVFASDRDQSATTPNKGTRESHLWISQLDASGEWNTPHILPVPINSSRSEISPFFGMDGYLYFATNRYPQSGFDIVRSKEVNGAWSEPERLAAPVNSSDDDCFPFITPDRKLIYFTSNRAGGKGGLDIYASGFPYRILLRGTITLSDQVKSTSVVGANIPITIEDDASHDVITITTSLDGRFETALAAEKNYTIRIENAECYSQTAPDRLQVPAPIALDTVIVRDYALSRVVFPTFELGRFNIPFFVTGYYIPNTPENLARMHQRIESKELDITSGGKTPYIDPDDEPYQSYADSIRSIFNSVYDRIERQILPLFDRCAYEKELLKIEVKGFVDPRGLSYGVYIDNTVATDLMQIEKGSVMQGQSGNIKLANLRAFYTLQMVDDNMRQRSEKYRELKQQGRVLLSSYGAGIDTSINPNLLQDPAKRRIDIMLSIVKGK